jgi:histidine racemase
LIESSGSDQIFRCDVYLKNNKFFVKVSVNICPIIQKLERDIFLVRLDDMSLLLCKYDFTNIKDSALEIFGKLKKRYQEKLKGLPAYGIVPFQGFNNRYRIFPVIYVRETDTIVLETGCGSASMALALLLRTIDNPEQFFITQPSDSTYEIDILERKKDIKITLSSLVDIIDSGTVDI